MDILNEYILSSNKKNNRITTIKNSINSLKECNKRTYQVCGLLEAYYIHNYCINNYNTKVIIKYLFDGKLLLPYLYIYKMDLYTHQYKLTLSIDTIINMLRCNHSFEYNKQLFYVEVTKNKTININDID